MTLHDHTYGFEVHPWRLRWSGLDTDALKKTETLFALSNGHIGLRGTFEEGEPVDHPGTYLNGFYEGRGLPYAESGYGYPESGQTVVNVTDGKIIRLLVEDEPMDLRYGRTEEHERTLDFRTGTLRRSTLWTSPTGHTVRIKSERLVSFTKRTIAAIHYEVEPIGEDMKLVLQSDLLANEPVPTPGNDPRLAAALDGGARLVDVRETDEYTGGHVPGAVHVALGTVPDQVHQFQGDGPVFVICKSGGRSMRACEFLSQQGVEVVNVAGGTMAWVNDGRTVVTGSSPL